MFSKFIYRLTGKKPAATKSVCTPCGVITYIPTQEEMLPCKEWVSTFKVGKQFSEFNTVNDTALTEGASIENAYSTIDDVHRREVCLKAQARLNTSPKYDPYTKDYVS